MKKLMGINKLMPYIKSYKVQFVGICFFAICVTVLQIIPVQIVGLLVDFLSNQNINGFGRLILDVVGKSAFAIIVCFGFAYIIAGAMQNMYGYWVMEFNNRIIEDVRKDLFSAIICDEGNIEKKDISGDLVTRSINDVEMITRVIAGPLNGLLQNLLTFGVTLIILGTWNIKLVVVVIIVAIILYFASSYIGEQSRLKGQEERGIISKISLRLSDVLRNLLLVHAYQTEKEETDALFNNSDDILRCRNNLAKKYATYWTGVGSVNAVGFVCAFILLMNEISNGICSVGKVTVIYSYLASIFSAMVSISRYKTDIYNADAALQRVFSISCGNIKKNVVVEVKEELRSQGATLTIEGLGTGYNGKVVNSSN